MALIGAFLAWLLFWEKVEPPVVLMIPVTQYDDPARRWPPNDYAENDYQALRESKHFPEEKEGKQLAYASQNKLKLTGELKSLHTPQGKDRAAVMFLWSLARTEPSGEVFLLPADALPNDLTNWVSLPEILDLVKKCPAKNKLLVLDIARPMADPRLGILTNDVADRVAATLEAQTDLPFFVLTSCGRGQLSLVAPELGRSVFGYYLDEGLLGQADLYNEERARDDRVTVKELHRFVRARADRWAHSHGTAQTPQLYGQPKDFALLRFKSVRPAQLAEPPAYADALRAGWEQWHEWRRDETYRLAPGVFRRLEGLLLRVEHRFPYGPKKADDELAKEFNTFKELVTQARRQGPSRPPKSLAMLAIGRDLKGVDEIAKDLDQVAAKLDMAEEKKKPMELAAARKELARKYKGKEDDVALAVWRLATDNDLEAHPHKRIIQLVPLLQAVLSTKSAYVETLFLERVAELKPAGDALEAVVRDGLRVVGQAEAVVTDPRVFSWLPIRDMLKSASAKRVEAELLLFNADVRKQKDAGKAFQDALAEFQAVGDAITTIQEGRRTLDRAQMVLPSYVPFLMKSLEWDLSETPEKAWLQAVDAARALDENLTGKADDFASQMDRVRTKTAEVKDLLAALKQPLTWRKIRGLFEEPSEASLHNLDALLEVPWFLIEGVEPAPAAGDKEKHRITNRKEFWDARQAMARLVQDRTLKLDEADNQNLQPTKDSEPMDPAAARRQEDRRAARRARISLELLKLGGAPAAQTLGSVANPDPVTEGSNHWNQRGKELAAAWSKLHEQIEKWLGKDPIAAERLSRVLHPLSPDWPWEPSKIKKNPTIQLYQGELAAYCKWLAEDYREKSRKYTGRFQDFYNAAADAYESASAAFSR
jgi:hypothetical protein